MSRKKSGNVSIPRAKSLGRMSPKIGRIWQELLRSSRSSPTRKRNPLFNI